MVTFSPLPGNRLDVEGAAAYLGKSRSWLDKERHRGSGPRYLRCGGRIFYRVPDLERWLDGCVVETKDSRSAA